ncbi:MAG: calcium/sodium antiporter [Treponema sp.]|jgi:cation:H+ antiporter|nr:calcium/sodium antiporter [Treponema sp.]
MFDFFIPTLIDTIPAGPGGFFILLVIILVSLWLLGKGADMLVDEAVLLSERWGVPEMIIGATVVSLGTTLPEVTVSVMSALNGAPGLAMGNAVGSIICDTGLILGVSALIRPLPFKKEVINRQGWIQLGAGVLLVATAFIFGHGTASFTHGGRIPRFVGIIYLGLLVLYIMMTIRTGKQAGSDTNHEVTDLSVPADKMQDSTIIILLKMLFGMFLVVFSSKMLIPAVQEFAVRLHIPETIIAATLVAFGTSLPELMTGITSARKGHGDLAIGNVMGADILNVLIVVGASAAVTPGGLEVGVSFFRLLFPAMLFILCVFKCSVLFSNKFLKRPVGFVLLAAYVVVTVLSYLL